MTARKTRSGGQGLWVDTRDGITPGEIRDNPRTRPCPFPGCRAGAGEPCTQRKHGRRVNRRDYHPARTKRPHHDHADTERWPRRTAAQAITDALAGESR